MHKKLIHVTSMLLLLMSQPGYCKKENGLTGIKDIFQKVNYNEFSSLVNQTFPKCTERKFWKNIDGSYSEKLVTLGREYEMYDTPSILPSTYMRAFENNNKSEFFKIQRGRRRALINLLFAECIQYEGNFIEKIADIAWQISEETYWGSPTALFDKEKKAYQLPRKERELIELYISETAKDLALVYYFLDESLDKYSLRIRQRILDEIELRLINRTPKLLENYNNKALNNGRINNWFAWIGKNWFLTTILINKNRKFTKRNIEGSYAILDLFYKSIPSEGSVNEGAIYWQAGFGKFYDVMLITSKLLKNKTFLYDNKVRSTAEFITTLHITSDYYINYSDSDSRPNLNPLRIQSMSNIFNSKKLKALAFQELDNIELPLRTGQFDVFDKRLYEIFFKHDLDKAHDHHVQPPSLLKRDVWLEQLGLLKSYSNTQGKDLILTVKVGNNGESHNHNDIGVFEIYYNGQPFIVDPGRQGYDLDMFGDDRYSQKYWFHTSAYHNSPVIGDNQQATGENYFGIAEKVILGADLSEIDIDMKNAYPFETRLESYKRILRLLKGKKIILKEHIQTKNSTSVNLGFITPIPQNSITIKNDTGIIQLTSLIGTLNISFDKKIFKPEIEELETDALMEKNWEHGLRRIIFKQENSLANNIEYKFVFKAE